MGCVSGPITSDYAALIRPTANPACGQDYRRVDAKRSPETRRDRFRPEHRRRRHVRLVLRVAGNRLHDRLRRDAPSQPRVRRHHHARRLRRHVAARAPPGQRAGRRPDDARVHRARRHLRRAPVLPRRAPRCRARVHGVELRGLDAVGGGRDPPSARAHLCLPVPVRHRLLRARSAPVPRGADLHAGPGGGHGRRPAPAAAPHPVRSRAPRALGESAGRRLHGHRHGVGHAVRIRAGVPGRRGRRLRHPRHRRADHPVLRPVGHLQGPHRDDAGRDGLPAGGDPGRPRAGGWSKPTPSGTWATSTRT